MRLSKLERRLGAEQGELWKKKADFMKGERKRRRAAWEGNSRTQDALEEGPTEAVQLVGHVARIQG